MTCVPVKDDPDFGPILAERTTIDIKDKYRNLSGKKNKSKTVADSQPDLDKPIVFDYEVMPLQPEVKVKSTAVPDIPRIPEVRSSSASTKQTVKRPKVYSSPEEFLGDSKKAEPTKQVEAGSVKVEPAHQAHSSLEPTANAAKQKADSMTVTVRYDQRTLMLNLRGSTKGSQLISFALKEFHLDRDHSLLSEGAGIFLDPLKPIREQVPMFDILKVIKMKNSSD